MGTEILENTVKAEEVKIKKFRIDKGIVQTTNRDREAIEWISEQYTIRFDALSLLLGILSGRNKAVNRASTKQVIDRWLSEGWVEYRKKFQDEVAYIWLTLEGIKEFQTSYKYLEPSRTLLQHYHGVNAIRLHYMLSGDKYAWKCERDLWRELHLSNIEITQAHVPDAEISWKGKTFAIEVELTRKEPRERNRILTGLASGRWGKKYDAVVYFCTDATELVIATAVRDLGLSDIVQVNHLREFNRYGLLKL